MKRRTQVLIDEDQYQYNKKIADERNVSFSTIVRENLPRAPKGSVRRKNAREVLMEIAATGQKIRWKRSPIKSTNIDKYLYGEHSKYARMFGK